MGDRDEGTGEPEVSKHLEAGDPPPPGMWNESEVRAFRHFLRSSGGSILFFLSALSIFYGLAAIVGPILGTSSALRHTLSAIGTIGLYEVSLFGVMLALVLRWRITRDTVSLFLLVAIFLITLGMLVSTVANDAPTTVLGVGAAVVALSWAELVLARRWMAIPMRGPAFAGVVGLLAWNGLCAAFLAQYIGADVESVRSVRDVWFIAAAMPIAGALLLYVGAAVVPTGTLAKEHRRQVFLRGPGMAWVFAGTVLLGTAVHQYAMRYVFDLPFYLVDYVPLFGVAALAAVEVERGYGANSPRPVALALAAPVAMLVAILAKSYDTAAGLGAGLLLPPALTFAGLSTLFAWSATRQWRSVYAGVGVIYALGILLLVRPATTDGMETINWNLAWIALGLGGIVLLLIFRNPTLWTLTFGAAAVIVPRLAVFQSFVDQQFIHGDFSLVWPGAIFGAGVVFAYCVFARRMPRGVAVFGALLLCLSAVTVSMHEQPLLHPALLALVLAVTAGTVYGRTRDVWAGAALCVPLLRLGYVQFVDAGAWRFMAIGFLLLALGAVWSVRGERGRSTQDAAKPLP